MSYRDEDKLSSVRASLNELSRQPISAESRKILLTALEELSGFSKELDHEQEEKRLAALYRVSHTLGSSLDLDEVLTQAMDAVIGLTNAERGFLVLLDGDGESWQLRAARNYDQENLKPEDMEISRTIVNSVLKDGKGVLTTDARSDPRFSASESVILYALRSILCAPLLSRGRAVGAIFVDNRAQTGLFSEADLELLNAFASQAAIAIENAWLYTQTDQTLARRVSELETLAKIDQDLNQRLDYAHVVEITHGWMLKVSAASHAWVLLYQEDSAAQQVLQSYPVEYAYMSDPAIQKVLKELTPRSVATVDHMSCQLILPILHSGSPLGVIILERSDSFSEADIRFLSHISGRAAAAIENARLYQAVQGANQAKSKFVSVVSHELRVPMTSIKGYADLLKQGVVGKLNDQQTSFIDVIRNNVERMSTLVSDLADISRLETGRLKLERAEISVSGCVEDTLNSLRPKLDEKNQRLNTEIPPDLPNLNTDPNRFVQVLTNLISNASKYTPVGGEICVRVGVQDEAVCIEVIDNGIGISPEDQTRLFTQFFRSDDPAVREEQGWGLGLNVAKLLVDLMGGEMGFHSVPGEGSTFWFILPTEKAGDRAYGGRG